MDDKTLRMTMLLDFFGDLLTEKQREYFELYHNENFSLSEIAESSGISRQGVYDIISRTEKKLEAFEAKTGVIRRFTEMRTGLSEASGLARTILARTADDKTAELARKLVLTLDDLDI